MDVIGLAQKVVYDLEPGDRMMHDSPSFQKEMREVVPGNNAFEFGRTLNSRFYVERVSDAPSKMKLSGYPLQTLRKGEWFVVDVDGLANVLLVISEFTALPSGAGKVFVNRKYNGGWKIVRIA
ncbi:hypothetical protein KNU94_gp39 [Xanthomonas phage FoX2]|uniref:Uncharacterized protein n=2 Tax=Foxunavirus TaxID=2948712 RepID=A0A858NQE4_9CAUD|nr:hypothetical protein KNU93_gp38 [Xanthomonas phage FoX1]YP_010106780.1 hypothetical protein KNU94_gp39 [Xanthomonas phage FoX2]QJB21811.1 hypothetical protein XccvBFoX1_gp72c [Xanthomonas phage FoX1]QJB21893.1 hypothetical protein XccvBFoX2_gp74c [Xanthomonas phage FoX2]